MAADEQLQVSVHISRELEKCGISKHKLQTKSSEVKILEHLANDGQSIHMFATGSSAEGVDITGSDRDTMVALLDVCALWSDDGIDKLSTLGDRNVFVIEQNGTGPCYCKLRLLKLSKDKSNVFWKLGGKEVLCRQDQSGEWYLSSELFAQQAAIYMSTLLKSSAEYTRRAFHVHGPCASFDNDVHETKSEAYVAFCIPCSRMPKTTLPWQKRLKGCGLLKEDGLEAGNESGCHLVAVGSKTTYSGDKEWRISFALLEREVIWNLSDMQIKCYVMSKMLVKQFVEPVIPDQLSSYMVKTVVLWLSDEGAFVDEEGMLIANVLKCLEKLCSCIRENFLPHYIIPESNLLLTKFEDDNLRDKTVEILEDITSWHWSRLLRCSALMYLQELWEEFQPDVQSFLRHARHPNLKPLVFKDVVSFRSVQSMYMSVCDFSNTPARHLEMLRSVASLPNTVDNQLVNFMAKVLANRLLFVIVDVDNETMEENQNVPPIEYVIKDETNKSQEAYTPIVTVDREAILKLTQDVLQMTDDTGNVPSSAEQWFSSRFDVSSLGLQQAVMYCLLGDFTRAYAKLQTVMVSYRPQVLYIGMCGPEEIGEFDFIEYLCYVTSSGKLPFAEKVSKCLSFDYVICRCDPILPIFNLERKLWPKDEVPICIHPRVLIHYLMFVVHFLQGRPESALASLSYLLFNVLGTAPRSKLYGHIGWNLVGHGYFLMGKTEWAMRAFRTSLKIKAKYNPAFYYLSNC